MEQAAAADESLGGPLDVEDPSAGGHPLRVPIGDCPTPASGVLVLERAVDDVGHGLEAAMGVPRGPLRLARAVVDLTHLIHVDEGVEVFEGDTRASARWTGNPSPS